MITVNISEIVNWMTPLLNGATAISIPTVPLILYLYNYEIPKYELKKGRVINNTKKIKLPPNIRKKANAMKNGELPDLIQYEAIALFRSRLNEVLTEEQQIIMNNNLSSLNIRETLKTRIQRRLLELGIDPYIKKKKIKSGGYSTEFNSITIKDSRSNSTIFHELMHMASTVKTKDVSYVGFKQKMDGEYIGQGLNEGYTQLLTEKFFPEKISQRYVSYPFETHFARLVEEIVGEEKMIDFFFKANLRDLMLELIKYSSNKETSKFIRNLDVLNKHKYTKLPLLDIQAQLQETIFNLNEFLMNAYKNKLQQDDTLTRDEKMLAMLEYVSKLSAGHIYTGKKFEPFPESFIKKK